MYSRALVQGPFFHGLKLISSLKKIARAVSDRVWSKTRSKIDRLYYTGGGLGDELMFTAIARVAKLQGQPIHVLTDRPEVWEKNTDILSLQTNINRWFYAKKRKWLKTKFQHLTYKNGTQLHLAEQMATHLKVELPKQWIPVFAPRKSCCSSEQAIVIQNSCRGAKYAAVTKEWPFERWNELARRLIQEGWNLVQIGTRHDPQVPGAVDLRGKTDLPAAASILENASLFIGLESGLMHLAAAVKVPSVIIYGGRTLPRQTGYPFHRHVTDHSMPCTGCGLNFGCPHDEKCLKNISVDLVYQEVNRALAGNTGLETATLPTSRLAPDLGTIAK